MTSWRVAKSLTQLRAELDAAYPGRRTDSDGTIGDARHRAEAGGSDHNPNSADVVCAMDITVTGATYPRDRVTPDGTALAEQLRRDALEGDDRINYVIWNRHIASRKFGFAWRSYSGVSPHEEHVHVSVEQSAALYDATSRRWLDAPENGDPMATLTDDQARKLLGDASTAAKAALLAADRESKSLRVAANAYAISRVLLDHLVADPDDRAALHAEAKAIADRIAPLGAGS